MTLEQLMAMGLTKEQAEKVIAGLDGNFVTKNRFNEVNTELKNAKDTLKERDGQLETLKKSTGDVEALTAKIVELQGENKIKDEQHQAEIKQMRFDAALSAALTAAKARNPETVKPLLKSFLDGAELEGDAIKGLDAEIKKLVDGDNTKFLFEEPKQDGRPGFRGIKPGENPNRDDKPKGDEPKSLFDAVKAAYTKEG